MILKDDFFSQEQIEPNSRAVGDINDSIKDSKPFDYKTGITERSEGLRDLTWSENCAIISEATRDAALDANPAVAAVNNPKNPTFKITDTKLYVPVVTLSAEDDNILLEQLKTRFKRTIKWTKYRSEMTNQTRTNTLNHLIDLTFNKVNRLSALSFENENNRKSFSKYYTPSVEIKDFSVLIDGKSFFDV